MASKSMNTEQVTLIGGPLNGTKRQVRTFDLHVTLPIKGQMAYYTRDTKKPGTFKHERTEVWKK